MTYLLLKFFHLLGLTLMGAGLIGVWFSDLHSRQVRQLPIFAEAVRSIRVFHDGLVVPGALLLLGSGTWLIVTVYGGWALLAMPWLVGMVALFAFALPRPSDPLSDRGAGRDKVEHVDALRGGDSLGGGRGDDSDARDPPNVPLQRRSWTQPQHLVRS